MLQHSLKETPRRGIVDDRQKKNGPNRERGKRHDRGLTTDYPGVEMASTSIPQPHGLYRCYDDGGQLLYVGISKNPATRFAQHADKPWWTEVRGITIDWYANGDLVRSAERRAIHVEKPLHNIIGTKAGALRPGPIPRCGHCIHCQMTARGREYLDCYVYQPLDDDIDVTYCEHCGRRDCLYGVGFEDGDQRGWRRAADFYQGRRA